MGDYYLAVDLGASGGRCILGRAEGDKLELEEIHRFSHTPERKGGSLVWDVERMFAEIAEGLEKCARRINGGAKGGAAGSGSLRSVGIDTWGVDYVLLDKDGKALEPVFAYRDSRTEPFFKTSMPYEDMYGISGIAFQPFNTVYQLLADKAAGRLEKAEYLLQLPEYFSQRLAGNLKGKEYNEYTLASTTGLMDAAKKAWSGEIFRELGLPLRLFKPLREPPYGAGRLSRELRERTGLDAQITMIASHDTASAVAVVEEGSLYISSGTWSLLGVVGEPILNAAAREAGYTNEGAHNGRIRFLKNIMGLWVIQSLRRELGDGYSYAKLEALARETEKSAPPDWTVDLNLPRFFSPASMTAELKAEYASRGKKVPESPGELAFSVYASLAQCYKEAILDLEKIAGKTYPAISVIGGGSKDSYLNSLTAALTGKKVYAGPAEATATGNILLQMKAAGDPAVKNGFGALVKNSFDIKEFPGSGPDAV